MTTPVQELAADVLRIRDAVVSRFLTRMTGVADVGRLTAPPVDVSRFTRPIITLPALPKIALLTR
ncbi:hypothetical protein [Limnoglobus roseus]|uniref:Uncharacterized protein n=1 Tax=Limnoglobus roseus TaxID=2598579 RepID=A0A5C1AJ09_9BACT|nr:hypothetical protein [Limnoglobus roseus]QEL18645.1 hypothetical protein PX52LOC_05678 [Limnoglobus roseus]